ncbi:hypothetical protein [Streptomyces sp. NPDC001970]
MQTYEPTRQPYPSRIPSATPIYDALCSEYRTAFRTLPGDRSGEEDLGFKGFGLRLHGGRSGYGGHTGFSSGLSAFGGHLALPPAPRSGQ